MAKYVKNRYGSIVLEDQKGDTFTITKKEQNEINRLARKANSRRAYMSNAFYEVSKDQLNMKGISKESYEELLNERGFITEKYTTQKNIFKSKEEVKEYIKELKTVTSRNYGQSRIEDIRGWYIDRVNKYYDGSADLIEKFQNMNDKQLISLYVHNDDIIAELWDSKEMDEYEMLERIDKISSDIDRALKGGKQDKRSKAEQQRTMKRLKYIKQKKKRNSRR